MNFKGIWEVIDDYYSHLAKDEDGRWFVYSAEPVLDTDGCWQSSDEDDSCAALEDVCSEEELAPWEGELLDAYWEESLQCRTLAWDLEKVFNL